MHWKRGYLEVSSIVLFGPCSFVRLSRLNGRKSSGMPPGPIHVILVFEHR